MSDELPMITKQHKTHEKETKNEEVVPHVLRVRHHLYPRHPGLHFYSFLFHSKSLLVFPFIHGGIPFYSSFDNAHHKFCSQFIPGTSANTVTQHFHRFQIFGTMKLQTTIVTILIACPLPINSYGRALEFQPYMRSLPQGTRTWSKPR